MDRVAPPSPRVERTENAGEREAGESGAWASSSLLQGHARGLEYIIADIGARRHDVSIQRKFFRPWPSSCARA